MKSKLIILGLASSVALGACAQDGSGGINKQTGGALAGALGGGLLGAQFGGGKGQLLATGAGTLLGAFLGSEVGKSLDRADQQYHAEATQQAHTAPIGQTIAWQNPDSGHSGQVTPIRDGYTANNQYCREYRQSIVVDGRTETATGTACQNEYGEWELVNGS